MSRKELTIGGKENSMKYDQGGKDRVQEGDEEHIQKCTESFMWLKYRTREGSEPERKAETESWRTL